MIYSTGKWIEHNMARGFLLPQVRVLGWWIRSHLFSSLSSGPYISTVTLNYLRSWPFIVVRWNPSLLTYTDGLMTVREMCSLYVILFALWYLHCHLKAHMHVKTFWTCQSTSRHCVMLVLDHSTTTTVQIIDHVLRPRDHDYFLHWTYRHSKHCLPFHWILNTEF